MLSGEQNEGRVEESTSTDELGTGAMGDAASIAQRARAAAGMASQRRARAPPRGRAPLQPNWQFTLANGSFGRIHGLIKSSYIVSSRPSIKSAVRHWVRFCALHGTSPFRPQVAENGDAEVLEEIILIMFLDYFLCTVGVQGSTCESYFSLMKGWHGEATGYQPAASGIFTLVWISKLLRGARRNFPSTFAEREAHSV